jgi:predicted flap endonuclease-1-like 5' DNA nuclease
MFEQDITLGPGTASFSSHLFEILIMLGVAFLLGLWLGWVLWSRYRQTAEKLRLEYDSLSATANALRAESDDVKSKLTGIEAENTELKRQLSMKEDEGNELRARMLVLEQDLQKTTEAKRLLEIELGLSPAPDVSDEATPPLEVIEAPSSDEPEDQPEFTDVPPLTVAELPEPPDEALLADEAVNEVLEDIDNAGEDNLELNALGALHNTHGGAALPFLQEEESETQAKAGIGLEEEDLLNQASNNDSEDQAETSDSEENNVAEDLDTNEDGDDNSEDDFQVTTIAGPQDDLKIVEGIGPKIEELLYNAGIHTYTELARTPVNRLKDILLDAGSRFAMHDPGTWSAQALLAANGEWDNLKAYQEFLNAGKRPKS